MQFYYPPAEGATVFDRMSCSDAQMRCECQTDWSSRRLTEELTNWPPAAPKTLSTFLYHQVSVSFAYLSSAVLSYEFDKCPSSNCVFLWFFGTSEPFFNRCTDDWFVAGWGAYRPPSCGSWSVAKHTCGMSMTHSFAESHIAIPVCNHFDFDISSVTFARGRFSDGTQSRPSKNRALCQNNSSSSWHLNPPSISRTTQRSVSILVHKTQHHLIIIVCSSVSEKISQ